MKKKPEWKKRKYTKIVKNFKIRHTHANNGTAHKIEPHCRRSEKWKKKIAGKMFSHMQWTVSMYEDRQQENYVVCGMVWYQCSTSYKYLWENYSNFDECKSATAQPTHANIPKKYFSPLPFTTTRRIFERFHQRIFVWYFFFSPGRSFRKSAWVFSFAVSTHTSIYIFFGTSKS